VVFKVVFAVVVSVAELVGLGVREPGIVFATGVITFFEEWVKGRGSGESAVFILRARELMYSKNGEDTQYES